MYPLAEYWLGIVYGVLIALGLTIIFGVMRIVNFAHGEMVVIGMYVGHWIWSVTKISPRTIGAGGWRLCCFAFGDTRSSVRS